MHLKVPNNFSALAMKQQYIICCITYLPCIPKIYVWNSTKIWKEIHIPSEYLLSQNEA